MMRLLRWAKAVAADGTRATAPPSTRSWATRMAASDAAQVVDLREFGATLGPGKHTPTTDNIPILTTLKSWK